MRAAVIGIKLGERWKPIHKTIRDIMKDHGVNVDFSYFLTSTEEDTADLKWTLTRNEKILLNNDFIVVENTGYSAGIGFIIAETLYKFQKPVLALFNKESSTEIPSNIIKSNTTSKLLTYREYTDTSLSTIIEEYINNVQNLFDTKGIFLIPRYMDNYLNWYANQNDISKSQIIRNLIKEKMKKDKDWNAYWQNRK